MGKFTNTRPAPTSPVSTDPSKPATLTYEGATAVSRDARSELFITAATNMVGEDTFYETASGKDARFRALAGQVAVEDPSWLAGFLPFLRNEMHMRSASIVLAAEAVRARLTEQRAGRPVQPSGTSTRQFIDSALRRADEPAEFVAYWRSRFGRILPGGVQRGAADAFVRLINEQAAIKYDGQRGLWRLGDVIEVVHPQPGAPWQAQLFRWLLDRRRHADVRADLALLPTIAAFERVRAMPADERRAWLLSDPARLAEAGLTWEYLAGLGPMDRQAWEAMIPGMGYMALLRNLRNFDEAGVSDDVAATVAARLADPEQVARSRQFPYRFLSAYIAAPSLRWGHALDQALTSSCSNLPELPGRTLVLVDTSASMTNPVSQKSTIRCIDAAATLGVALARRNADRVDIIGFADGAFVHHLTRGGGVLADIAALCGRVGEVGYGTRMFEALAASFQAAAACGRPPYRQVVILSDMQTAPYLGLARGSRLDHVVPAGTLVFGVNTAGYASTPIDTGVPGFHEVGGFSDRLFTMLGVLTAGRSAGWPWETRQSVSDVGAEPTLPPV